MRKTNVGKIAAVMAVVLAVTLLASAAALCENTAWDCPDCGRTGNIGNFCGGCGHPATWPEGETTPPDSGTESGTFGTGLSQAEIDAANGLVPCFGMTREELLAKVDELYTMASPWRKNEVPDIRLGDLPLVPVINFTSTEFREYFGYPEEIGSSVMFGYDLLTGVLRKADSGYDPNGKINTVVYCLDDNPNPDYDGFVMADGVITGFISVNSGEERQTVYEANNNNLVQDENGRYIVGDYTMYLFWWDEWVEDDPDAYTLQMRFNCKAGEYPDWPVMK